MILRMCHTYYLIHVSDSMKISRFWLLTTATQTVFRDDWNENGGPKSVCKAYTPEPVLGQSFQRSAFRNAGGYEGGHIN